MDSNFWSSLVELFASTFNDMSKQMGDNSQTSYAIARDIYLSLGQGHQFVAEQIQADVNRADVSPLFADSNAVLTDRLDSFLINTIGSQLELAQHSLCSQVLDGMVPGNSRLYFELYIGFGVQLENQLRLDAESTSA